MEISNNFTDMNTIKASQKSSFDNIDSSKLTKDNDALRDVTDDFEAFFMQQLLDISLKDVNLAGEGSGSDIIKGMYTETIANESTGTMGISDLLYNFLSEQNK